MRCSWSSPQIQVHQILFQWSEDHNHCYSISRSQLHNHTCRGIYKTKQKDPVLTTILFKSISLQKHHESHIVPVEIGSWNETILLVISPNNLTIFVDWTNYMAKKNALLYLITKCILKVFCGGRLHCVYESVFLDHKMNFFH